MNSFMESVMQIETPKEIASRLSAKYGIEHGEVLIPKLMVPDHVGKAVIEGLRGEKQIVGTFTFVAFDGKLCTLLIPFADAIFLLPDKQAT